MPPPCRKFNSAQGCSDKNCHYPHVKNHSVPCMHYNTHGGCRDGDKCLYRHDDDSHSSSSFEASSSAGGGGARPVAAGSSSVESSPSFTVLCKYYQAGYCGRGESCEYAHVDTEESRYNMEHFFAGPECPECPFDSKPGGCYRINAEHHKTAFHPSLHRLPERRHLGAGERRYDWVKLAELMPTEQSEPAQRKRKDIFRQIDYNGNGYISLAEIDKWFIESLGMKETMPKKVMLRAFMASNSISPPRPNDPLASDMVTWPELRMLFVHLRRYLQLYEVFDDIDSCLGERDGRITMREFQHYVPKLTSEFGVPGHAIDKLITSLQQKPMQTMACQATTTPEGHMVLFHEFCVWGHKLDLNLQASDKFTAYDLHGKPRKTHGEY